MITGQTLTIATAGHVDHGKTSLVNRITGVDTDTLAEEKARGLTINLGFAYHHFTEDIPAGTVDNTLGFVDVPGHTDFIHNMLAGVGMVDCALLVIAADDGIMPQTREHLAILDLLGIKQGVVAITKVDRVDSDHLAGVTDAVNQLLADTQLHDAPIFPVSNITGTGIDELTRYLQGIAKTRRLTDATERHFRFAIDRAFSVAGIGTVITGTVASGQLHPGEHLLHSASAELSRVKGLRHDDREVSSAIRGQRVALNITLPYQSIRRGDWLMNPTLHFPVYRLDARIKLLQKTSFKPGTEYHLYIGTAHHMVSLRALDDDSGTYFQIKSSDALFVHFGDRFILRDPASQITIGGGVVIDIYVPRRKRSSPERLAMLKVLDQADLPALKELLETQPGGIDPTQFSISRNIKPTQLETYLRQLQVEQLALVRLKTSSDSITLLHESFFNDYQSKILQALSDYHRSHTDQAGMSEPALSQSVEFSRSHLLFHTLLEILLERELIKRSAGLLHLPEHNAKASAEEQNFINKLRPLLLENGFVPLRTRELAEQMHLNLQTLEKLLNQCRRNGNLIQVADNRYYLPETIMALAELTEKLASQNKDKEGFSVIQFRDASNIGRNLCIEILEYFDRAGFTRRDGNSRFIRTDKENVFGK